MKTSRTADKDELRRRVDEVLYYVWDPIGVSDEPFARSEYESYVPRALELLVSHDDTGPISGYLADIIRTRMALSPNIPLCDHTAALLLEYKKAIKEGCA